MFCIRVFIDFCEATVSGDDSVPQLIVNQTISAGELGLDWGISDLLFAEISGRRIVYVLSRSDQTLVELEIAPDGTVSVVQDLELQGSFEVGSSPELELYDGMLSLAGLSNSSGQFVSLSTDGALGSQYSEPGVGELVAPLSIGGFLVSADESGNGLVVYEGTDSGLAWVASVVDDEDTFLGGVWDTAAITTSGANYLAAVSRSENGVTLVEIGASGTLSAVDSLGTLEGLPISQPIGVEGLQRVNESLLVVAASGTSSLSTMRVDANGELWLTDHVLDSSSTRFQSVSSVDAITVGNFAYVAAGGADGGISLFTILAGGRLVHLSTTVDTASTTLYRVSAISISYMNGSLQILGGSAWEAGLTRLSYDLTMQGSVLLAPEFTVGTDLNDQLMGSDTADVLDAGAGEDILFDGHGSDTLTGGSGQDLFVFSLDGVEDLILDFERGVDRLDLSSFDFLYDVSQLSIVPTSDGAEITFADEVLRIISDDGQSLSVLDFENPDILNIDRPPLLNVSQTLDGGAGDDVLNGISGDDTISGFGGNDILSGGAGADLLDGGDGDDTLDGGVGHDILRGGDGRDLVFGGADDDFVSGGDGGDTIYGDDIA